MTKRSAGSSNHSTKRPKLNAGTLRDVGRTIDDTICEIKYTDMDDDEIIQHSESMLKDLQDLSATVHATRAAAFDRKGDIKKAMEEASNAIKACPGSPEGYIITSDLYCARGQYKAAVKVLEDGLRAVQPKHQGGLYDRREEARRLGKTKIDFVRKLPSEVLSKIFSFLYDYDEDRTVETMTECVEVSKSWRSLALKHANCWEKATIGIESAWFAPTKLFQTIAPFIKDLGVWSDEDQLTLQLIDLAQEGRFSSVQNLTFSCVTTSRDMALYMVLITSLGKQLKSLSINGSCLDPLTFVIPLDIILTVCSNLKELRLNLYNYGTTVLVPSKWANLPLQSSLEILDFQESIINADILQWLIPRCPRLHQLSIRRNTPNVLALINRHCPEMKVASLSRHCHFFPRRHKKNEHQKGIHLIACSHDGHEEDDETILNLVPLFKKSKNSLKQLWITANHQNIDVMLQLWKSVSTVQYDQLTEMYFESDAATSGTVGSGISKFLHRCPALETLYLKISGIVTDHFFTSLIKMPHLRDLALFNIESCGGLKRYLDYLAALGQQSPLQVLGISYFKGMTDELLAAVAKITTLRIIHFRGQFPLVEYSAMLQFFNALESNGNLDVLMMDDTLQYQGDDETGKELESLNNMTRRYYKKDGERLYSIELRKRNK